MSFKVRAPGAVAVVAALLAVIAGPVSVGADGPDEHIAYTVRLDTGGAAVFIAAPDGGGAAEVPLDHPAEDFGLPVWSPDNERLLISHVLRFDGGGDLMPFRPVIVEPDGSGERLLAIPNGPFDTFCGTWAASSDHLLCGFGGDVPGLYRVATSGAGEPVRLWDSPVGGFDVPMDVSPDRSQFAFVRFRPGPQPEPQPFRTQQVGLFVANVDGTGVRQIVPFGIAQGHELAAVHWSPDGRWLISSTTQGRLFTASVENGRIQPIRLDVGSNRYFAFEPDWSPDGAKIVFVMFVDGQVDLFTANRDGSAVTRITDTPDFENGPDWGATQP